MSTIPIDTLKKRADFLAMRGCRGVSAPAFLLVWRDREDGDAAARVGFTVTRKLGGAVRRNRIKRRLRAAAREVFPAHAAPGMDYALIARQKAYDRRFTDLLDDMKRALLSTPPNTK